MRHDEAWPSTVLTLIIIEPDATGELSYLTRPIPAMRLPQEFESAFRNPAKAPNSKNGDSASNNKVILSRAFRVISVMSSGVGCGITYATIVLVLDV